MKASEVNPEAEFGFNVIGYVSGNLGLGVTARNVIEVLLGNGFSVAAFDVDPGQGRWKYDTRYEKLSVHASRNLPYAINLLVMPPNSVLSVIMKNRELMVRSDRLNVAWVVWELPVLTHHWRRALEFFDVLVAQSEFIRYMLDFSLSQTSTVSAKHPLYLPNGISPSRERFGIAENEIAFVTGFEPGSDPIRKNTRAVLEAFRQGLDGIENARLLIRVNNARSTTESRALLAELQSEIAQDSRIRLLSEPLSYGDVLSLYASSDVFVSLHRAEGLGLGPMEAMALGKPVIATAWSGNMTYMDHTNACLVPYRLVPVAGSNEVYSSTLLKGLNAVWANPDVREAAIWMRQLAEDGALRNRIGARAAHAIKVFHAKATEGQFALEIQDVWHHRSYAGSARNRDRQIADLQSAAREWETSQLPALARIRKRGIETLNRHLLWRLRRG